MLQHAVYVTTSITTYVVKTLKSPYALPCSLTHFTISLYIVILLLGTLEVHSAKFEEQYRNTHIFLLLLI